MAKRGFATANIIVVHFVSLVDIELASKQKVDIELASSSPKLHRSFPTPLGFGYGDSEVSQATTGIYIVR